MVIIDQDIVYNQLTTKSSHHFKLIDYSTGVIINNSSNRVYLIDPIVILVKIKRYI